MAIKTPNIKGCFIISIESKDKNTTYYFKDLVSGNCFWRITEKIKEAKKFDSYKDAIEQKKDISFAYTNRFDFEVKDYYKERKQIECTK